MGITTSNGDRYVALSVPGGKTMLAFVNTDGSVWNGPIFRGRWGVPMVTYRDAGGLSLDGRRLVLQSTTVGPSTSFLVLGVRGGFHVQKRFTLRGTYSFDALSPDASRLYLIDRVSPSVDLSRYIGRGPRQGRRRRHPPHAALHRRDAAASDARATRPSASATTRRWNTATGSRRRPARPTACRPRPSGNTPAAPGRTTAYFFGDDPKELGRLRLVRGERRREDPAGRPQDAEPLGPPRHDGQRGGVVPRPLRRGRLLQVLARTGLRSAPSSCRGPPLIPTSPAAAPGPTAPRPAAAPPGGARTPPGTRSTRTGASGGSGTPTSSASASCARSRSRTT